ncbi:helix-turn-helix domain-containing protein [Bdellovibrio sp. HCB-110]|uniref:helix-turn-helix domain-containing protein n=1 Tax=Bdellovibrio sp. HCB-110 TaxID=3391182 RepID=UPI0039B4E0E8
MKKTGEILKKAREEKGLSLHEIGLSLKINSKVLKAIEEGDDAHLPAKTFLRGFVQSYANFLHLDSEKVLEVFYEEMGSTRPKPYIRPHDEKPEVTPTTTTTPSEAPAPATTPVPEATITPIRKATPPPSKADGMQSLRENKTSKTIIITVVGVVLVGLILFTKKMIDKYSKEAEVPSNEVAQTIEGATPVTVETPQLTEAEGEPTTAPSPLGNLTTAPTPSAPASLPSPTPTTTPGITTAKPTPAATPTVTPTPITKPSPTPTPVASPSPSPSPTATPVASPSPTPTPTPKPTPEGGKPVELIVEALDTVEIEYASTTGKPQKIKLSAEQVHTFKSKSGLKINFSNGGAVNLILNGKEVGIPGDLGKPIKLSY